MNYLTAYQQDKFSQLDKIAMGRWYAIKPDRPDREEFIECLKKYIDTWNTLEINGNYTAFKKVFHPGSIMAQGNEIADFMPRVREYHNSITPEHLRKFLPNEITK